MAEQQTTFEAQQNEEKEGGGEPMELTDNSASAGNATSSGEKKACQHYSRMCKLKADCCSKFFDCRFCHDEVSNHEMDRHKVKEIQCIKCDTVQQVVKECVSCGIQFGEYFCQVCRLYDKDNQQFHCDKCGICRVGPKEKYFHCDRCNACLGVNLQDNHKCVENMSKSCCPVCQEFLHTSRSAMQIPRCGHMIHTECLQDYYQRGLYQCPLCKESLLDMSREWERMDEVCASVQLPKELQNVKLQILCQDCHKEGEQLFNTEGLKCNHCGSYNTTQK